MGRARFRAGSVNRVVTSLRRVVGGALGGDPLGDARGAAPVAAPATGEGDDTCGRGGRGGRAGNPERPTRPSRCWREQNALAPWEEEEAWSRPSKLAARSTARRGARDDGDDAATNWRSWADEAADRVEAVGGRRGAGRRAGQRPRAVRARPRAAGRGGPVDRRRALRRRPAGAGVVGRGPTQRSAAPRAGPTTEPTLLDRSRPSRRR